MTELNVEQHKDIYFRRALTLFRELYEPFVLHRLQHYFGADLLTHLNALDRGQNPFKLDRSGGRIQFDINAITFMLTSDGGLRANGEAIAPRIFAHPQDTVRYQVAIGVVFVIYDPERIHEIRRVRNSWANHKPLDIKLMIRAIESMIEASRLLPAPFLNTVALHELDVCVAQLQLATAQSELNHAIAAEEGTKYEQSRAELSVQSAMLSDMQLQIKHMQEHDLAEMNAQIAVIRHDQHALFNGTLYSMISIKHQIETRLEELRTQVIDLGKTTDLQQSSLDMVGLNQRHIQAQQEVITDLQAQIMSLHVSVTELIAQTKKPDTGRTDVIDTAATIANVLPTAPQSSHTTAVHVPVSPPAKPLVTEAQPSAVRAAPTWVVALLVVVIVILTGAVLWLWQGGGLALITS
ncbi:MAG: hypothetical protein FJ040_08585 [Chloroflexi bacterium]|nr:hypothetical protein [Chloroflexota bacterium]